MARVRPLRQLGKDEYWLQDRIYSDPSILGLGDLERVSREKTQSSGGKLDMLLKDPRDDSMFEVEVMLGETDESHIIRCIEYWDLEKRRWPQRKHTAVLVAEKITSRFYNVVHLFSQSIPLIGIQFNTIELEGNPGLHFTKVIDSYEEPEVESPSESPQVDEAFWSKKAPEQVKLARCIQNLASEILEEVELRFLDQYMVLTVGRYDRVKFWSRKADQTLLEYRLEEEKFAEAVVSCQAHGIEPSQKGDKLLFQTKATAFSNQRGLHEALIRSLYSRELRLRTTQAA